MDCCKVWDKLIDFNDGELPLLERLAVQAHLSGCYSCSEELADVRRILALCREALLRHRPANRFGELKLSAASVDVARKRAARQRRMKARRVARGFAVAAAVALVFILVRPAVQDARRFLAPFIAPGQLCEKAMLEEWRSPLFSPVVHRLLDIEGEGRA